MAYEKNVSVLQNNNLSLSGSVVTVTGSLYGSFMSGTISEFTEVNAQYVDLAYDGEPTHETGRLYYDTSNDVFAYDTEVDGVNIRPGRQLAVRVKNASGGTLNKGKIVRIVSASSNSDTPNVSTASYDSEYTSADTLAMMMNNTDADANGYALLYGVLTNIDTNSYDVGDMLYLSSSGDFTTTAPQSPLHEVRVGQVVRSANNGTIYVKIQNGYESDELHDVLFSSKAEGDLISWDATTGVWRNKKQLTGSYEITGDITASNGQFTNITADKITAREYHTELVSASIIYQSGSTKFGDTSDDVHDFTGSVNILSGNLTLGAPGEDIDRTFTIHGSSPFNKSFFIKQEIGGPTLGFSVGNQSISFGASAQAWQYINHYASTGHRFYIGSSEKVSIDSNGNFGIGGVSPGELLDVRTSTATAGQGARLGEAKVGTWEGSNSYAAFTHNSVHGTANSYALLQSDLGETVLNTATGRALWFRQNNSTNMVITSAGNVGIGKTTANSKLDVYGNAVVSGSLTVTGTVTELSTKRIKKNIRSMKSQLDTISKLNPVTYYRRDTEEKTKEYGFISEEVKEVYPEFVKNEGVNYSKMVSVLVSAVKELKDKVEEQQKEIEELKKGSSSNKIVTLGS